LPLNHFYFPDTKLHLPCLEAEFDHIAETLETQFFQDLLGLREDFFISLNLTEKDLDFKIAIKQTLKNNFAEINFEENQETSQVLKSIGFDYCIATRLGKIFGHEIQDKNILWEKIQSFVQVRLDALVISNPEWSKNEQKFDVFNNNEKKNKQYQSVLIPSQKGSNGNDDFLKTKIETPVDDPSTTETWYHATTFREAEEIMKNGFSFRGCMKNRNFSHQDGIYFTDSITSAKQLFHHNAFKDCVVYPDTEYKKRRTPADLKQLKIVVLAFTYHKDENNLLRKYEEHSINLRDWKDPATEERLKKIVNYFSQHPLPTSQPTVETHGLHSEYEDDIEYIIGPHAIISGPDDPFRNVYINGSLTQLCVRCVGRKSMKKDFEILIQKEVYILDVDGSAFCK
jgi:hypothetical protein